MNKLLATGRLTKDPDVRYTSGQNPMAIAKFSVAIDRPGKKGENAKTDFPRITVFGKQAENCEKYLSKGRLVAVEGRLQTDSYQDKDGKTVYTTDVVAERVEFLEWGDKKSESSQADSTQEEALDKLASAFVEDDELVNY